MIALGMLILGTFVGFCCLYVLFQIKEWKSPLAIINGICSAAVSGGLLAIFNGAHESIGNFIYYYPVGLGYGGLFAGVIWVGRDAPDGSDPVKYIHIFAFGLASLLLIMILVCPWFRALLPSTP